jgi:radical SAM superfamily enzyme YgiQ (UPF0313 family)|tara:strand:- start:183 stop:491 length:309 start_codon:yes stop_codon:yes gene_type:complete
MNCFSFFIAASLHLGLEGDYNNLHPHARCDLESFMFGSYYNSERKISHYVGKNFKGLEMGLVTGYHYEVSPMIRYKKNFWFVAPAYEVTGNVGLTIGVEYQL